MRLIFPSNQDDMNVKTTFPHWSTYYTNRVNTKYLKPIDGSLSRRRGRRHAKYYYSQSEHLAAAAAANLLHSCPTLCDPIDGSPPSSPIPGILHGPAILTPGHISREKHDLKGCMHLNIRCSTAYNSQDMEAT